MPDDDNVIKLRLGPDSVAANANDEDTIARILLEELGEEETRRIIIDAEFLVRNINYVEQTRDRISLASTHLRGRPNLLISEEEIRKELAEFSTASLEDLCKLVREKTWTQWENHASRFAALELEYGARVDRVILFFPND